MKTFTDNAGRTWTLAIHVTAIKRCRAMVDVDLYGLAADGFAPLNVLLADPPKLVDVLFVLCRDQATQQGVTDEDFGRALAGDSLQRAADAFVGELIDFFPDPAVRGGLTKVIEKSRSLQGRLVEVMGAKLDQIDIEALVNELTAPFGGSRGSLESTPDPSRSANLI